MFDFFQFQREKSVLLVSHQKSAREFGEEKGRDIFSD